MNKYSYLILRLALGASMLGHGLVRMPKLAGFSSWMVSQFDRSLLPGALVVPFSYALPFLELITGLLLVAGLLTRQACMLGGAVMVALIFGTTMIEAWENLPSQLIHAALAAVLLHFADANSLALDTLKKKP